VRTYSTVPGYSTQAQYGYSSTSYSMICAFYVILY
jgi:hypothetical protein